MTSDNLKELASLLREKAASLDADKAIKCGQTLQAAQALRILREKVSTYVR